jgi:hypothetical protein
MKFREILQNFCQFCTEYGSYRCTKKYWIPCCPLLYFLFTLFWGGFGAEMGVCWDILFNIHEAIFPHTFRWVLILAWMIPYLYSISYTCLAESVWYKFAMSSPIFKVQASFWPCSNAYTKSISQWFAISSETLLFVEGSNVLSECVFTVGYNDFKNLVTLIRW